MTAASLRLGVVGRFHAVTVLALVALAVVAWLVTGDRMAGMDAGPGTDPGTLGFFAVTWVVMMAAMMFPSIAPMVLVFAHVQRRRRRRDGARPAVSTWVFVGGYLAAWTAFGLAAYGTVVGVRELSIDALGWDRAGREVAAGVIAAAAVYQLTPLKDACLRRCRAPLDFVMERWRERSAGALRMGAEHGAWCVGCCWALMAALFALGVMSLAWMAAVAALIAVEKLLPWKAIANRGVAAILLCLALAIALVPDRLPGLTVPGSAEARQAEMRMMGPAMKDESGPRMGDEMRPGHERR